MHMEVVVEIDTDCSEEANSRTYGVTEERSPVAKAVTGPAELRERLQMISRYSREGREEKADKERGGKESSEIHSKSTFLTKLSRS